MLESGKREKARTPHGAGERSKERRARDEETYLDLAWESPRALRPEAREPQVPFSSQHTFGRRIHEHHRVLHRECQVLAPGERNKTDEPERAMVYALFEGGGGEVTTLQQMSVNTGSVHELRAGASHDGRRVATCLHQYMSAPPGLQRRREITRTPPKPDQLPPLE